jgi:ATP-binding cassette subfamily C (CFTR/MRP) protein 10
MIAVVGTVGSGKTSLINAILSEVRAIAGTVFVKGRVAYFAQTPFIMNNTLKENILFCSGDEPSDVLLAELRKQLDDSLKSNQVIQRKFDEAATTF